MSNKQQDDRRNTRCGIILGMITILISTLLFLFNFEKYIFNYIPQKGGELYVVFWIVTSMAIGTVILILIDIFLFFKSDLLRLDIMKTKNAEYCNKMTDKYYHQLVSDFNMTICIAALSFASIAGIIFYKVLPIWLLILIMMIIIILLIIIIWEKWQILLRIIRELYKKIFTLIVISSIVFVVILSVQVKVHGNTEISYDNDGTIKICNESNTAFGDLSIEIYSDNNLIKQKNIDKEKLFYAKENKNITNTDSDGKIFSQALIMQDEVLHWKYIEQSIMDDIQEGQYIIVITIKQQNNELSFKNQFSKENNSITYGVDSFKKKY